MRSLVALTALLLAACQVIPPPAARNCAVRPADFLAWHDFPANVGGARWIAPPHKNTIRLARTGVLTWNGAELGGLIDTTAEGTLDQYLAMVAQLAPRPFTTLTFDGGVPCARVERIRELMRRHLACDSERTCFQGPAPAWLG